MNIYGGKFKYAECTPSVDINILPQWDSTFPAYLKSWDDGNYGEYARHVFNKDVKICHAYVLYDVEEGNSELRNNLKVTIHDNEIKFSNSLHTRR